MVPGGSQLSGLLPVTDVADRVTVPLLLRVRTVPTEPGGPWALMMPPPEANRPVPAAVLPFTSDLFSVIVPWFTMPAPLVWLAVLLSTWVLLSTASPPFAMPPAAIGGPPWDPGWGAGAVAVLPLTWLLLSTRWLVSGGMPPLPFPLAMPPPFSEVLPLTWLLLTVTVPSRSWMPPPPALGAVLPFTWLPFRVRKLLVAE